MYQTCFLQRQNIDNTYFEWDDYLNEGIFGYVPPTFIKLRKPDYFVLQYKKNALNNFVDNVGKIFHLSEGEVREKIFGISQVEEDSKGKDEDDTEENKENLLDEAESKEPEMKRARN